MHQEENSHKRSVKGRWFLALVKAIIAAPLIAGGGYLLTLGGSPYYLLTGLAVAASAYFAFQGSDRAIQIYLAMLLATLVWTLIESSNIWGVQARLFAPAVLGAWVAWPWLRRLPNMALMAAALVVLLGIGVPVYSAIRDQGSIPQAEALADGNGEWRHYGNDQGGTKFSPISQINRSNIGDLEHAGPITPAISSLATASRPSP